MDNRYVPRGISPPRSSRHYLDPRASTGTVIASSFDARRNPTHRGSLDPSRLSGLGYEAQPIKKKTYVDSGYGGSTASRTEYAVRPRERKESLTNENRRPVSSIILPVSPTRNPRPVITSNFDPRALRDPRDFRERPRSPVSRSARPRDDPATYLSPVSAPPARNHQRHHSATPAEMDRLTVSRRDRDGKDRAGTRYHGAGESRQSAYPIPQSRPPIRIEEEDVSYTGPREQFARDYPQRRPRGDSYTRSERPVSVMGPQDWKPVRERRDIRDLGPPPSASRQFERLDRPDNSRRLGHESDSDRDAVRRRNSTKNPVLHQSKDEDYDRRQVAKQNRDRYEDDGRHLREREHEKLNRPVEPRRILRSRESSPAEPRRIPRSRDSSPEQRSGMSKGLAAVGLGGLAAAGLAGARHKDARDKAEKVEESDSDRRNERRRRKHRERDPEEDEDTLVEHGHRADRQIVEENTNGRVEDIAEDGHKHRKHRRRRHRHRDENDQEVASESSSEKPVKFSAREETVPRGMEESDISDSDPRPRDITKEVLLTGLDQRTISPGEDEDDRPRRVALVEPPKDEERPKPKSILKQRLTPFPEDLNPVREGVAPLKEAGKEGVPPGARWTKINRVLVNPEALEKSKLRFEERDDYVIVLRVLTKEEIAKLAEKTREIRGK
jgi:hypothetical protein